MGLTVSRYDARGRMSWDTWVELGDDAANRSKAAELAAEWMAHEPNGAVQIEED